MPIAFRWAVRVLLVLLFLFSLLVEGYFVPRLGLDVVHVFPEAWDLFVPALVWSILFIGCGQAILVVVGRLVSLVARERIFSSAAVPWVRALIVVAVIALVLLVAAFVALSVREYTPPLAMYGLIGLFLLCLTFALVVWTMLGLLRRSTRFHDELEEVI